MAEASQKTPPPAPQPSASRDNDDDVIERRTLRDYYIILRERLWIALPIALLASVGYGYWKMRDTPLFAATATMQFEKPDTVLSTQTVVDTAIRNDMDMNTAIQQLTSGVLRRKVIESFTPDEQRILQRAALKRLPPGTSPTSFGLNLGNVSPSTMRNSYLISINVTHEDPEAAMLIANRYVRQFMDYLLDNAGGKNSAAVEYLEQQAGRLEKESEAAEQKLQQYIRSKGIISLDSSKDIIGEALKKVGGTLIQERLRLREVENQYNQVEAFRTGNRNLLEISFIATHGSVPGGPFSPNKTAITRTAVGIGVLVFLGIAVGLSFIDDRIKSAWDVESFIGANLLGIIPDLSNMKDEEKYTLLLENKQAPGVEAFLSVYSSIKIHSKLDFPKSILVTSTIPGEGKTLISCNVAGSFARHGKRTLLIDCDLRRPMLHRHFKQQNNAGLIPWFEGGASLEGDLATSPTLGVIKVGENLSLLCSGGRSKSPTEFLESPLFGQLLEKLKREYDLVIVDSPPLGAVTDSLLIAERIDEVIYVCRFNRAYRKHIRLYMRALRNGKNEVLGVVLNGLSPRRIEYYSNYRYYRSYKKYYGAQT